jgi:hypothetical protein
MFPDEHMELLSVEFVLKAWAFALLVCYQDHDFSTLDGSRWRNVVPDCPRWPRYLQIAPNDHMELSHGKVVLPARAVAVVCYQIYSRQRSV